MSHPFADPQPSLHAALERAARRAPQRGIAVFEGRGTQFTRRTYPQVLDSVRRAAGRWSALGVAPGDRILISLPTSWAWLEAWLGALFCGALPVAMAPAVGLGGAGVQERKVEALAQRLQPRYLVAKQAIGEEEAVGAPTITPQALAKVAPASVAAPEPTAEATAFLQLTSGSTGVPRAVMISHRAAMHNPLACAAAIGAPHGAPTYEWADAMVSWLPLHHDMGLIGCLFVSIVCGHDLWLLQPTSFLARPRQWLEALGSHGTVFAPAPNFGYQLCVERLDEAARGGLDLSTWHDAMTGAEMIRPETVEAFCAAFEPHGFRPQTFRPCYGMAESTLAATFDLVGRGVRTVPLPAGADSGFGLAEVVSVGVPVADTEVAVCAPGGQPLPEGEIGEVRIKGPGVFSGYYNDPEATAAGLQDGWLVTGDLGFLHRGELYLTGRLKDLLIVHGHNLMPHELEWLAEEVTGGGGAQRSGAFSVARDGQGEEAVLVVEVGERDPQRLEEMGRAIRSRIGRTLSLPLADLVFVRRGKIPKTTSGKVQRRALRELYLRDELVRL